VVELEGFLGLMLRAVLAGWRWLAGGFEHGPDDLAAIGGRQNPEPSREPGDHAQALPVKVMA
jgi:hypothetical protein